MFELWLLLDEGEEVMPWSGEDYSVAEAMARAWAENPHVIDACVYLVTWEDKDIAFSTRAEETWEEILRKTEEN